MPWLQAHLEVEKSRAPLVELLFEQLGALSVTLVDARDEPMLEPPPGAMPLWQNTRVTGLFDGNTDADHLRARIDEVLDEENSRSLTLEILEDQAWERAWLEHFQPMRFGDNLWICPTGRNLDRPDATVIHLDPGLAFGTGTHPTTALCLEWIDGADLRDKTVIDFGCGSGILAIAALKRGAARAVAVDHDPQALTATRSNARRNGVLDRLETLSPVEFQPLEADLVLANILANVLIELAPQVKSLVRPGGDLVLSGILHHQAEDVARAYHPDIEMRPPVQQDEWIRLEGRRK